jgi:hypothetical protein
MWQKRVFKGCARTNYRPVICYLLVVDGVVVVVVLVLVDVGRVVLVDVDGVVVEVDET